MMKTVGIIPARYQSSRFPGKPLAMICGKPLIWWVYNQAIKVEGFYGDVYVATDSKNIFDVCENNNIRAIMTSESNPTGTDRLGEVAQKIHADFYINIQGDEPLIEPESVEKILNFKNENPTVDIINTMTKIVDEHDINSSTVVKVVSTSEDDLVYLSRAAVPHPKKDTADCFYRHLGLYGLSREALLNFRKLERTKNEKIEDIEMLRFIENGYKIKIINVDSSSVGVDLPEDIIRVEKTMQELGIV